MDNIFLALYDCRERPVEEVEMLTDTDAMSFLQKAMPFANYMSLQDQIASFRKTIANRITLGLLDGNMLHAMVLILTPGQLQFTHEIIKADASC